MTPAYLTCYGFLPEDEILREFRRDGDPNLEERDAIVKAANRAIAIMELRTRRKLAMRVWRAPESVSGCVLDDTKFVVTGTGFTAGAVQWDQVIGVGIAPGTRVASVDSNVQVTLTRKPTVTGTGKTLAFGTEQVVIDGSGDRYVQIPHYPTQEVISAGWLDAAGSFTGFNTAGVRLDRETGRYYLPNDRAPLGDLNVLVECRAGYQEPTGEARGDEEWYALGRLQLRIAQICFEDSQKVAGRAQDFGVGGVTSSVRSMQLPKDIEQELIVFQRRF